MQATEGLANLGGITLPGLQAPKKSLCPMRNLICLVFLAFLAKSAAAQVLAKATVDSTRLVIGDQVRLHLDVSHPAGTVVQPVNPKAMLADSTVEFLGERPWDTLQVTADRLRLRKDFLFTAWDSGQHQVPQIPVVFLNNGTADTFLTLGIPLTVSLPAADTTLADIKPILAERANLQDFLPYLIGIGVLLLLAGLLVWLLARKKRPAPVPQAPAVVLLPHELALQKLAALAQKQLWQSGQVKAYHSELTYILREYLEARFGIQALEQTTDEVLAQLRRSDFDASLSGNLAQLLQTADLVKFAKALPPPEFHTQAMQYVEAFIGNTRPAAPKPEGPGSGGKG